MAFDAVGTLIYPEPSVSKVYWNVGRQFGSQQTLDQVRTEFQQAFQDLAGGARGDYSTSETEEKERWRHIVSQVLFDVIDPDACFEDLHAHFGKPSAWRTFPDVAETLQHLDAQGIEVLVASNFDERLHPLCDELPELRLLRKRVVSASIGWHKPSPHFYTHLIEVAGCPADQILMVGDDLENDVVAAQASGLPAVWINREGGSSEAAISDLRQLVERIANQSCV
ncbi:MAG: yjjG [Planctomycetaceae bacterium]|nr:yjjG [Planctomycetaceae bacterium]